MLRWPASGDDEKNLQAAAELARWESTAGWEPVPLDSPWPWLELVRWVDSVTVLRAYRKKEVVVGELEWRENAFGEAVDRWAGQAVFAILTLQQPAPPMAVREFRPQRQGDFWERFRVLGAESISPELLAAHLNDEIPPWTLTGEKLFFVMPLDGPLRAEDLEQAAATLQRLSSALAIVG